MWAINSSNLALVSYLVKRGADVQSRSTQGTSCEDFIVSVAPMQDTTTTTAHSTDHELIADLIFDQLQVVAARPQQPHHHHPFSPLPSFPSPLSSRPTTPHTRSASVASAAVAATTAPTPRTHSRTLSHQASSGHLTTSSTSRRLVGRSERAHRHEADLRAREVAQGRRKALLDIAVLLDVQYADLVGQAPDADAHATSSLPSSTSWAVRKGKGRRKARHANTTPQPPSDLSHGCGAIQVGADALSVEFHFDDVLPHQMLVLGEDDVDPLLDVLITRTQPTRAPWTRRAEPANVLYLALRWAAHSHDDDLLVNILYGALERIEECVRENETAMTHLAFWLFNLTLLLHYCVRDNTLSRFPKMHHEYLPFVADLINETYVTVIRDTERRINRVLEAAMLEHESIPGFEDVRFEGEWKFIKTLTGSVKSSFGASGTSGSGSQGASTPSRKPLSQIFARTHNEQQQQHMSNDAADDKSPRISSPRMPPSTPRQPSPPRSRSTPTTASLKEASYDATAAELLATPCPRTITSLLTSALHVLQLYEINPATIIQALSQVFYWIGSELFNKVLNNKRYLCRSKAMQLKLNVSALEDWARSNALPLSIVNTHLAPLNQLISWLACQSSLREFDSLIATMQGLRSLNPLQMRRAVRDYRYEVGETRMSDECLQYLDQYQVDWERNQEALVEAQEEQRARRDLDAMRKEILRQDKETEDAQRDGDDRRDAEDDDDGGDVRRSLSHHHRSGTATQNGPTPDSRSPSPSAVDDDSSFETHTDGTVAGAASRKYSLPADPDSDTPELQAQAAQAAIDSLFLPGRSMSDYTPPIAPEPHKEAPINRRDTLHSSAMLPFALPSRVDALVVSPGDAFGFGRGHFTGTGTAALRQARGVSATSSPLVGGSALSTADSPLTSLTPSEDGDGDAQSLVSGGTAASTATSTTSNLFASGKGFAAGGYWQPVPLLGEDTFQRVTDTMRYVQRRRESLVQRRLLAGRGAGGSGAMLHPNGWSAGAGAGAEMSVPHSPRSPSIVVQSPLDENGPTDPAAAHWSTAQTQARPQSRPVSPYSASTSTSPRLPSPRLSPHEAPSSLFNPHRPASPTKLGTASSSPAPPLRKASGYSTRAPALNLPRKVRPTDGILDESVDEEERAGPAADTM